ncbi:MAG: antibiotic biosynthesis monooxygenase [Leptospirales bacterium]|jgi:heme-degrading monooxygenase HmoA
MIAVIFELEARSGRKDEYFAIAEHLKPLVEDTDGFISIERFQSVTNPDKYLSLSFWRDEEAVTVWRRNMEHQAAQRKGREHIFSTYRLRVARVVRDYDQFNRQQAPDAFEHGGAEPR